MRKFVVVFAVILLPFAAIAAPSETKAAAIHQLMQLLGSDSADESSTSRFAALDHNLTEAQANEATRFFTSPTGRQFLAAMNQVNSKDVAALTEAIARAKAKRTAADIRSLATALEARATDENSYPSVKTLDEIEKLVSPTYIRTIPRRDGWDHEYVYIGSAMHYRLISAGPDGKVSAASRNPSAKSGFGDDIVYEDGEFLAVPDDLKQ